MIPDAVARPAAPLPWVVNDDVRLSSALDPSRLGVIYMPQDSVPYTALFEAWLRCPATESTLESAGDAAARRVRARLEELAGLLMWPTLSHMSGRASEVFREEVPTVQVTKISMYRTSSPSTATQGSYAPIAESST